MANNNRVIHGSIALIKVNGVVIGKMRSIQATENFTRLDVQGLGTVLTTEVPVTKWSGSLSCEFMSIDFTNEGIIGAVRRNLPNIASQVFAGEPSFEDQLSIDSDHGVQIDVYKKIEDLVDSQGVIKPKAVPYAIITRCLLESESFNINEGSIGAHSQSFRYLDPITVF